MPGAGLSAKAPTPGGSQALRADPPCSDVSASGRVIRIARGAAIVLRCNPLRIKVFCFFFFKKEVFSFFANASRQEERCRTIGAQRRRQVRCRGETHSSAAPSRLRLSRNVPSSLAVRPVSRSVPSGSLRGEATDRRAAGAVEYCEHGAFGGGDGARVGIFYAAEQQRAVRCFPRAR